MAKFKGTDMLVYVDSVAIAHTTNCTLNLEGGPIENPTKDDARAPSRIAGRYDWSIVFEGLQDFAATYGVEGLANLVLNGTEFTVKISTEEAGTQYFEGQALADTETFEYPDNDNAGYSGTFVAAGALTPTDV